MNFNKFLIFIVIFSLIISIYPIWLYKEARGFELGIRNQELGNNNIAIEQYNNSPFIINAFVDPTDVKPGDTMLIQAELKALHGISQATADMGGIETINLELNAGTIYEGIWQANWLVHDVEVKTYTTIITATNALDKSSLVSLKWTDAAWTTPSAVANKCGEDSEGTCSSGDGPATASIDEDTGNSWCHSTGEIHWIIYDMGTTYDVQKVRIYTDPDAGWSPCKISALYVCDDSACSGESSLGSCDFSSETSLDWYTCDKTDTEGRYIKIELWVYDGDTSQCVSSDALGYCMFGFTANEGLREFDAYAAVVNTPPTAPTTLYSNNTDASSCCSNPTNLTDTTPVFSAIYNDPDPGDKANQYRIQVDDNSNFSSTIWDSNTSSMATTTEGNRGPDIEYSGNTLSYNTTYYWRIRFVDDEGAAGAWSTTTSYFKIFSGYEMGSDTYRMWQSSINVGGHGGSQTSTSYHLRETIGEIATGLSTSTLYKLFAGYQQMQEVYLALSAPSQVTMSPSIGGITGGQSDGTATTTVTTDSPSGYALSVRASSSPAMATSSYSFADYIPAIAGTPDYTWSIPATTSEFGFTPEGSDIVQKFLDNGSSACNTGSSETTDACWYNFSTSDETISQTYSANHPNGTQTIIKFKAESGTSNIQEPGEYQATITITAIPN